MPWGWECRARLVKQIPLKPTERRGTTETDTPGPNHYEPPKIFCGSGYNKIKRSPAYTFGHLTKVTYGKPIISPYAPVFNVRGLSKGAKSPQPHLFIGRHRITHCVVTPRIEQITGKTKIPGPAEYRPRGEVRHKRPPAYSMRPAARPPYQAYDQWTPPPNMYWPMIPSKKPPAYSLGYADRKLKTQEIPGPGAHDPNFRYVKQTKPSFSIGGPHRKLKSHEITPSPNIYCEKKFMVNKPTTPAPSFGIRHSPYLGEQQAYLKSSKIDLVDQDE